MRDRFFFLCGLLWIVAFSVFATILLSIPLFSLNIGWENLTGISGFSHEVLMENYYVLMGYLLNPFESVLNMPDFPSSASALEHFSQVKWLFIFVVFLVLALFYFIIKFIREHLYIVFRQGIITAMIVPLVIIVFTAIIGFDSFFVFFHETLFPDDTWLFNPATDPIITVLTANFFMLCFVIFAIVYELILLIFMLKGRGNAKKAG